MFNVYLNEKRDRLLVIARGQPIPVVENAGRWRKRKATVAVSDEIKSAIQRDGFYWRRLRQQLVAEGKRHDVLAEAKSGTCRADAGQP